MSLAADKKRLRAKLSHLKLSHMILLCDGYWLQVILTLDDFQVYDAALKIVPVLHAMVKTCQRA